MAVFVLYTPRQNAEETTPRMATAELQAQRKLVIQAHLEAECITHDVDATISTFRRPRLEIPALAATADGPEAVHNLVAAVFGAFPDFYLRPLAYYDADTAVIVEVVVGGTQIGPWESNPPSGRSVEVYGVVIFEFDEAELICEKIFFDHATLLRQIQRAA